jgi:hypothetical protein
VENYFILVQKSLSIIHFPQYWINMQAAVFPNFQWTDGFQETTWTNTASMAGGWGWGTSSAGKAEPDASSDLCVVADWFENGRVNSSGISYKIWMWNNVACTQKRAFICKYFPPRESSSARPAGGCCCVAHLLS